MLPFTRELAATGARGVRRPPPGASLCASRADRRGRLRARARPRRQRRAAPRDRTASRGFQIEAVPLLELDGAPVSSTRIRGLLGEGRVAEAARLLGRYYSLAGSVVAGDAVGRHARVPDRQPPTPRGEGDPGPRHLRRRGRASPARASAGPAAMSIGVRPTFGGKRAHARSPSARLGGRARRPRARGRVRGLAARPGSSSRARGALALAMRADVEERTAAARFGASGRGAGRNGLRADRLVASCHSGMLECSVAHRPVGDIRFP